MRNQTKRITLTAMFCAIAFALTAICRIPFIPSLSFLKYDPKDVIAVLSGLVINPMTAAIVSVITSIIEMFTISDSGIIGCIMNILSTCSFACTAAFIYKKKKTLPGAAIGLLAGCLAMAAVMLLWNYCITPIYMGYPREAVAALLIPAFLPFNLIKGGLNAAFAFLLYKPVIGALRKTNMVPHSNTQKTKVNIPLLCVAVVIVITCVLLILSMKGII